MPWSQTFISKPLDRPKISGKLPLSYSHRKTEKEDILHQLSLVVFPMNSKVLYVPGGAGFLPSTLVGGFNPSEKYARQNGNLPQVSG